MGKVLKTLLLPLMLVSILSLPITLGCNGDGADTTAEFSQQDLEEILAESIDNTNTADSYQLKMDMGMDMDVSAGGEEGNMNMDIGAEGALDQKSMEMYLVMEISMAMDMGDEKGSEEMTMDMYLVDDYLYMKMDIPDMGEEWMKMEATEDVLAAYDVNLFEQQIAPLESAGELTFKKYEKVRGSQCYVIELVPDMETMMEWMGEQGLGDLGLGFEDIDVISEMFDELKYTCWIDTETKYMRKMTINIVMEMSGSAFRDLTGESGRFTMDMNMDMEMWDFNKPVNIVLPDEALDAMEMGDFAF